MAPPCRMQIQRPFFYVSLHAYVRILQPDSDHDFAATFPLVVSFVFNWLVRHVFFQFLNTTLRPLLVEKLPACELEPVFGAEPSP